MKTKRILFIFLTLLIYSQNINCASLDGTTNIVYKNYHYPFAGGDTAEGFVRLASGFTIPASATVTFNINPPISGAIELRDFGRIKLDDDLYLDSSVTLSSGGYINGQGSSIFLTGNLTIPDGKKLIINGNTIIKGNHFDLILGNQSQLIVDSSATLTLKDINIKNTHNDNTTPPIKLNGWATQLALDNVTISCNNDFVFPQGQMFIHNDVIFTGTSKFIYKSSSPSYIQPHSQLFFDNNTTFDYCPSSTRNDLITLVDNTASIFLNGCTLQTTDTGIKLTKGQLFFDNKVTLSNRTKYSFSSLTSTYSTDFGTEAHSVDWSPNGNYLAVAGNNGATDLIVYSWNGSTLTQLDTRDFSAFARSVAWSHDGNYLAVGGSNGSNDLIVYSWNGSTLTQLDTRDFGVAVIGVDWSPNDNYLAVAGNNGATDVIIYSWNGSTLTPITSKDFGSFATSAIWSPDENHLAVSGNNEPNDLVIYSWDGSTLTIADSKNFGVECYPPSWSPDGNCLAVGGNNGTTDLIIYSWNGFTLTPTYSKDFGTIAITSVWSNDGNYLAVGGDNGSTDLVIYSWNGSNLTQIDSKSFGTQARSASWTPDDNYLAIGGNNGSTDLAVYDINYSLTEYSPTFYNSIRFGDSSLGSEYNLNTYLMAEAQVDINCLVWIDDAD